MTDRPHAPATTNGATTHKNLLIVHAHPAPHVSRANRAFLAAAKTLPFVTLHEIYDDYPGMFIDVRREQALLLAHDIIVLQHPFYWYSVPALLKEWIDLVLEHGWAYGPNGEQLAGKGLDPCHFDRRRRRYLSGDRFQSPSHRQLSAAARTNGAVVRHGLAATVYRPFGARASTMRRYAPRRSAICCG